MMIKYIYFKGHVDSYTIKLEKGLLFRNKIRFILAKFINKLFHNLETKELNPQQNPKYTLDQTPRYALLKYLWIPRTKDIPTGRLAWNLYYSPELNKYKITYGKIDSLSEYSENKIVWKAKSWQDFNK